MEGSEIDLFAGRTVLPAAPCAVFEAKENKGLLLNKSGEDPPVDWD